VYDGVDIMSSSSSLTVVIVGGSFAGITAAHCLKAKYRVILIEPKDYFEYSPAILNCFVGNRIDSVINSQLRVTDGWIVVSGLATAIAPHLKKVHIKKNTGEEFFLAYDAILISSGVSYPSPIRSFKLSMNDRKSELYEVSKMLNSSRKLLVVGGGLIGVELVCELASKYTGRDINITLMTSGDSILSTLPPKAGELTLSWLISHHVNVIFNDRIASVGSGR
jgi:apoptosis-inducing factor 2